MVSSCAAAPVMLPNCRHAARALASDLQVDDDDRGSRQLQKCRQGMVLLVAEACSRR